MKDGWWMDRHYKLLSFIPLIYLFCDDQMSVSFPEEKRSGCHWRKFFRDPKNSLVWKMRTYIVFFKHTLIFVGVVQKPDRHHPSMLINLPEGLCWGVFVVLRLNECALNSHLRNTATCFLSFYPHKNNRKSVKWTSGRISKMSLIRSWFFSVWVAKNWFISVSFICSQSPETIS